jgi:hypothetical protein
MRKALQCLVRHRCLGRGVQSRIVSYRHSSNTSNAFSAFPCNPYLMKAKAAEISMPPLPAAKLKH